MFICRIININGCCFAKTAKLASDKRGYGFQIVTSRQDKKRTARLCCFCGAGQRPLVRYGQRMSLVCPETLGALNGMNILSASVRDGTSLLEYIRKQQLKYQQQ